MNNFGGQRYSKPPTTAPGICHMGISGTDHRAMTKKVNKI